MSSNTKADLDEMFDAITKKASAIYDAMKESAYAALKGQSILVHAEVWESIAAMSLAETMMHYKVVFDHAKKERPGQVPPLLEDFENDILKHVTKRVIRELNNRENGGEAVN